MSRALDVRRVRADREHDRQPRRQPVDHGDALLVGVDLDVHVHAADPRHPGDLAVRLQHREVAVVPGDRGLAARHRAGPGRRRHAPRPRCGRGRGRRRCRTRCARSSPRSGQRGGARLQLVPEQLLVQVLVGPERRIVERPGSAPRCERGCHLPGRRIDQEQLLLDPDGPWLHLNEVPVASAE